MNPFSLHPLKSNNGHIMILALGILAALSVTTLMAMDNTLRDNKLMSNNRKYRDNLYRAETGITLAMENEASWLNPNSGLFNFNVTTGIPLKKAEILTDTDNKDKLFVAEYRISRIESNSTEFYQLAHQAQPSAGSGYSPRNFQIRRYGIFSTGRQDNSSKHLVTVEAGVSRIFNKP